MRTLLVLISILASSFALAQIYWRVDPTMAFTLFVTWLLVWTQAMFVRVLLRREAKLGLGPRG